MNFDFQILEANEIAAEIYYRQLRNNKSAVEYCLSRGLSKNTLSKYKIGYAIDNIIINVLRSKGLPFNHLASYDGSDDIFKQRIIIPNRIRNSIAMFTGRSFPPHNPKYLYSRGIIEFLFNEELVHTNHSVVIVESPICAITLTQYGFPGVAKFGTGHGLLSHLQKTNSIYLMPDREKSNIGVIDAVQCAAWLNSEGYANVKIALLEEEKEKVDPNSYMLSHSKKDLIRVLKNALLAEEVNKDVFKKAYEKHTKIVTRSQVKIGDDIELIKSRIKLTSIVSQYTQVDKETRELTRCVCPFHQESVPSFYVYNKTQTFFCFGCRVGGDVISFIQKIEGISFVEAIEKLKSMN
jgi:DNA primase